MALFNQPNRHPQQQQQQPPQQLPNFMTDFGAGQRVHPFTSQHYILR
jgi:hypothetical protein